MYRQSLPAIVFAASVTASISLPTANAGDLFVGSLRDKRIKQISDAGVSTVFAGLLSRPFGLAFDTAGYLFVSTDDGTIEKLGPNGGTFASTGLNSYPTGLAFNQAGNLFSLVDMDNMSRVLKYDANGFSTVFATTAMGSYSLAFNHLGDLYVANFGGFIMKFTPDGVGSVFITDPGDYSILKSPVGLAFDSADNLYVANFNGGTIEKITPEGTCSTFAAGLEKPMGLAFSSTGDLFVSEFDGNRIVEFTPGGVGHVYVEDPGDFSVLYSPTGLAFQPRSVPEASTATFFGLGSASLILLRSRRRS